MPQTKLVNVDPKVRVTPSGNPYYVVQFAQGIFGKPTSRTIFGKFVDSTLEGDARLADSNIRWEVAANYEQMKSMVGREFSAEEVEVLDITHAPKKVTIEGREITLTTTSVVRFSGESMERIMRRFKLQPPGAEPSPAAAPANPFGVTDVKVEEEEQTAEKE